MDFKTIAKPAFRLAGLAIDTSFQHQAADAAKLAAQFFHQDFAGRIIGKLDPDTTYSLHANWRGAGQLYTMVFGYAVRADAAQAADVFTIDVPAGRYAVFTARGPQPQAQVEAWEYITTWRGRDDLERSAEHSFQEHGPRSRAADGEVDIYIPMIPRGA